jgi:dimethylamine---corrinoid protein Co-methyltransferase
VGAGDAYGQAISHGVASGMGGIRTAGDLVARMQITRGMRLREAKEYVAGRLGVGPADLSDPVTMLDLRKEFGLGAALESGEITRVDEPIGLEAKFHIAELLDVPIASVQRFRAITQPRRAPRH